MIKAEVITHEGIPGPNWLDRCKSLATPTNTTTLVVVLAAAAVLSIITVAHKNSVNNTNAGSSIQANTAPSSGLQVKPLVHQTTTDTNGMPLLQNTAGSNSDSTSNSSAKVIQDRLGAGATNNRASARNNSHRQAPLTGNPQQSTTTQAQLRNENLTNNLKSTVNSLTKNLNDTFTPASDSSNALLRSIRH